MENKIEEPKPRKVTEKQRAARSRNIVEFNKSREGRPAMKHGAGSRDVMAGKLPKGFEELQGLVDGFYDGWVQDLGGSENLTSAKRALLYVSRGCLAVFALGLEYIKAEGLLNCKGDVQPIAKVLATYGNSLRLHLQAAGLERIPRNVTKTLEARMEEIAEREETESSDEAKPEN